MQKTAILLSFLGLWLTSYLDTKYQSVLGLSLIFSFGILHGANDLKLINQIEVVKKVQFLNILAAYVLLVLFSVVLFMKIPLFALVVFIIVSAFHFGEQNWQLLLRDVNKYASGLLQFSYGLLILAALFYFNAEEVTTIIYKIAAVKINKAQFLILLLFSILLYVLFSFLVMNKNKKLIKDFFEQSFYILVLCVIFKVASLILGFAIYFILWHSIPSLHDQIKFLYGEYSFDNFKKYFKEAFWYWIISLMGVFILYFIAKDKSIFDALFFSFLASITFPHFIVIVKMYKQ